MEKDKEILFSTKAQEFFGEIPKEILYTLNRGYKIGYDDPLDGPAYAAIEAANKLLREFNLHLTIEDDNHLTMGFKF